MSRGTWNIEKWNGASWASDGTIYRPNENLNIEITGTQSKVPLANGDNAFFTPEVLYTPQDLTFQWLEIYPTDAFLNKIRDYVKNGSYLRITDHLSNVYYGKFMNMRRVWLKSVSDTFDIESIFSVMAD